MKNPLEIRIQFAEKACRKTERKACGKACEKNCGIFFFLFHIPKSTMIIVKAINAGAINAGAMNAKAMNAKAMNAGAIYAGLIIVGPGNEPDRRGYPHAVSDHQK